MPLQIVYLPNPVGVAFGMACKYPLLCHSEAYLQSKSMLYLPCLTNHKFVRHGYVVKAQQVGDAKHTCHAKGKGLHALQISDLYGHVRQVKDL